MVRVHIVVIACLSVLLWTSSPAAAAAGESHGKAEASEESSDTGSFVAGAITANVLSWKHDRRKIRPIHPEMTFEEYQDATRSAGPAWLWWLIPGGVHYYAGETRDGLILSGTVAAGMALIIIGASMGEPEPITSEYDTLTFGEGEEARVYAQVPVERTVEGEVATTRYRLDRLHEEGGGNGLLVALGITAIASAYVVDLLHGIHMIELKKDRVHFKYGKRPGPWKLQPTVDVNKRGASGGLKMQMNF